jgi:hypothetical protein
VPKWLKQLPKVVPWLDNRSPYYNLNTDESQITEIMNYAWAWHEIVGGERALEARLGAPSQEGGKRGMWRLRRRRGRGPATAL